MTTVAERLAARTEALVAIPSESRHEEAILTEIRRDLPSVFEVVDDRDSVLFALPERRPGAPLVLLAGHVDTMPIGRSAPGRDGETLHGRGTSDMKSGLAVMGAVAEELGSGESRSDLDVGLLFFGREELPFAESALVPLFDRRPEIAGSALAIGETIEEVRRWPIEIETVMKDDLASAAERYLTPRRSVTGYLQKSAS